MDKCLDVREAVCDEFAVLEREAGQCGHACCAVGDGRLFHFVNYRLQRNLVVVWGSIYDISQTRVIDEVVA